MNWKDHINDIAVKLNRANALLFKIRNFVNITILKTIYFAIFDSHINYANLVWAQNSNAMNRILTLQNKAMRIITLESRNCHASPLFSKFKLLKFNDKLLKMCFWSVNLSTVSCPILQQLVNSRLFKASFHTNLYQKNSIAVNAIDAWNKAQTFKLLVISFSSI